MKAVCILLLSLAVAYANVFSYEEGVLVLTTSNFDQALTEFDYTLVEFYAPWCGHCKRLAPEYSLAAQQLAESHPQIKLAKLDATVENALAEKYDIEGFPTLKLFVKGSVTPIDYQGGRTAGEIVNWLKRKAGSVATELNSVADVEKTISGTEAVALFLGPSGDKFNELIKVANAFDDVVFINSNDDEVKGKFEVEQEALIVFSNFGEERNVFTGPFSAEALESFINSHKFPTIMPFNQAAAQRIFGEGLNTLFLIIADNEAGRKAEAAFRNIASEAKDSLVLCIGRMEEDLGGRLAEYLGVPEEDLPTIRIVQPHPDMRKFTFHQELSEENIRSFINDYKNNNLKPFFKSEPIPEQPYEGNVRVVVGKNFDEIVKDETKDVFIEFYAPWCGHCQSLAPIYESFAGRLRDVENLVIAKMDAVANEAEGLTIEGFPTLQFYPRNRKSNPIEFDDERSEEGLVGFIRRHATVPIPEDLGSSTVEADSHSHSHAHDHDHDHHHHHDHDHHHAHTQETVEQPAGQATEQAAEPVEQPAERQERFSGDL